jgi:hypothetical protein
LNSEKRRILHRIRTFKRWKTDNGHQSEHDFGYFKHRGRWIFWAIHYQDANDIGLPSEDPANPFRTQRLLIVAVAPDYDDDGGDEDEGDEAEPLEDESPL